MVTLIVVLGVVIKTRVMMPTAVKTVRLLKPTGEKTARSGSDLRPNDDVTPSAMVRTSTTTTKVPFVKSTGNQTACSMSAIKANEEFVIEYLQGQGLHVKRGLGMRVSKPDPQFESPLLCTPPLTDFNNAADRLQSNVRDSLCLSVCLSVSVCLCLSVSVSVSVSLSLSLSLSRRSKDPF